MVMLRNVGLGPALRVEVTADYADEDGNEPLDSITRSTCHSVRRDPAISTVRPFLGADQRSARRWLSTQGHVHGTLAAWELRDHYRLGELGTGWRAEPTGSPRTRYRQIAPIRA
jgi:hypothetical protein